MKTSLTLAAAFGVAGILFTPSTATAQLSINSGSFGAAGNGAHTAGVVLGLPSPIFAGGGTAVGYSAGNRTTVPFDLALNPASNQPFTIEFWANPSAKDNDDAVVVNRFATGNRSGWSIFQREEAVGWNLRMFNGVGSEVGWDLTGGTAVLNTWTHVVATWSGSAALLYVNGALVDSSNDTSSTTKTYNSNTAATPGIFSMGSNFDGGSPSTAALDEVAFYSTALTPTQISDHFALAASPTAGAYASKVIADGAVEYLQNVPEPASVGLMVAGGAFLLGRRQRRRA